MSSSTTTRQIAKVTFTLNNYTPDDEARIQALDAKYIVYGREIAPTTGTPHLQGMVIFKRSKRFQSIVAAIGGGAHIEPCRDARASATYCKKDGDFYERGELTTQGARTDTKAIKDAVLGGRLVIDLLGHEDMNPQTLRYAEGLQKYVPAPEIERQVRWFWGPSGAGKTRTAIEEAKATGGTWVVLTGKLTFLNGYTGQENVIFDDFRRDDVNFNELLTLLDRSPKTVNVKGSSIPWMAKKIWLTCPDHPKSHFLAHADQVQVIRRILGSPGGAITRMKRKIEDVDWDAVVDAMDPYAEMAPSPPATFDVVWDEFE